jgi:uncharacterized SAM-binding protein YcdF (DUF218 family)
MFYYASKILGFLTLPLSWVFILLLCAAFFKNPKAKQKTIVIALLVYFVMGNSFIANFAYTAWETKPIDDKTMPHYKIGIVLGGISYYDTNLKRLHFQRSSDRIFQALDLYKQHKIDKIFISGGAGYISKPYETEAVFLRDYLLKIGIPDSVILFESKSKNTAENALYTKEELINKNQFYTNQDYLLITSGYHMKRALSCFKKQGFKVAAYSVDGSSGEHQMALDELLIPNFGTFQNWDVLIHEWIGFAAYKISGKA